MRSIALPPYTDKKNNLIKKVAVFAQLHNQSDVAWAFKWTAVVVILLALYLFGWLHSLVDLVL